MSQQEYKKITEKQSIRELVCITKGELSVDGDGVKSTRLIDNQALNMLDPFLLLDLFIMNSKAGVLQAFDDFKNNKF